AMQIAASDTDLAGFQADLGRLKKGAEEAGRVAADLESADRLFAQGQLDAAEAKYKQIAASSSDRAVIDRTNKAIQDIRLKRVEAQIQPRVQAAQAAEAKGDLNGALTAWKDVERLNASYPGVKDKLSEINRALNKERIAGLEKALDAAYAARAG